MRRRCSSWVGGFAACVVALAGAGLSTSCGGGATTATQMFLVEHHYVDPALMTVADANTTALPRNAQILMKFNEEVNPGSVTYQSIQVRRVTGEIPLGSFFVDGNHVRFDPTVTLQGLPNPLGFEPLVQYTVFIPSYVDPAYDSRLGVVQSRDADMNQTTFRTGFTTANRFVSEQVRPRVLDVRFEPAPGVGAVEIPGNGRMAVEFSEAMDAASFVLGPQNLPLEPRVTIDVRYDALAQANVDSQIAGMRVPGFFELDESAMIVRFQPTFSFGDRKLIFSVECLEGLTDLVGNRLANPSVFGPYTCDGRGFATGQILREEFVNTLDADPLVTDALWGSTTLGTLEGQPFTSRVARMFGYREAGNNPNSGRGTYILLADPLVGADLGAAIPPTNQGRRVLLAFRDSEIGPSGTITAAAWGPDSNATFAARYQNIFIRMGHQVTASMNLVTNFADNYAGTPQVVYNGDYEVAQVANVGNTFGEPAFAHVPGYIDVCGGGGTWNQALFDFTGFSAWPAFTNPFAWDAGTSTEDDSVLLFDVSAPEGTTWQGFRTWFPSPSPCFMMVFGLPGYPQRRLLSTYEGLDATIILGTPNPDPPMYDTAFTVTKLTSRAQSLFYTYPGHPAQAWGGTTFGDGTDYQAAALEPRVPVAGTTVEIEYQGADSVAADRRTIDPGAPFTGWTNDINDCDGMRCIRWRVRLTTNMQNGVVASLTSAQVGMTLLP